MQLPGKMSHARGSKWKTLESEGSNLLDPERLNQYGSVSLPRRREGNAKKCDAALKKTLSRSRAQKSAIVVAQLEFFGNQLLGGERFSRHAPFAVSFVIAILLNIE